MRIPRTWVPLLAKKIIADLLSRELIELLAPPEKVIAETERLLVEDLMVEDKLNEEVREMLKKYASEIEKGRLDYRRMFELTKKKIIQEKGLVL